MILFICFFAKTFTKNAFIEQLDCITLTEIYQDVFTKKQILINIERRNGYFLILIGFICRLQIRTVVTGGAERPEPPATTVRIFRLVIY